MLLIDTLHALLLNIDITMIYVLSLGLVLVLLVWMIHTNGTLDPVRYRKRAMLAGGELEFFYRLRRALPECHVFPQVAMSALVEPMGIGKARQSAFARIMGKRVGYAVFDDEMKLLAVVELDYRSRLSRQDAKRDACFSEVGVKTVRFQSKRKPSEARIKSSIFD